MYVSSVPNLQGQYCFAQKEVKGGTFCRSHYMERVGDLMTWSIFMKGLQNLLLICLNGAYCSLRNEMERNEMEICSLRNENL